MSPDEINALWKRAITAKAELANELFQSGSTVTPDDVVAVALLHPESYEIVIKAKES
jgi:hypothetical protein